MNLVVNGKPYQYNGQGSIAELLEEFGANPLAIAMILNGEVVPRSRWNAVSLSERDEVELLAFSVGG
jgi:thiamine biosynthesis protein ThiS